MQRRCDRNRKRSKRRAIYCPIHQCYLHSVSRKYPLFADRPGQLQQRGVSRKSALMLTANYNSVSLPGEWLEAFWCDQCQETTWYHIQKQSDRSYLVKPVPQDLWQQVYNVIQPSGNPSVGEFTRRQSRMVGFRGAKDFTFVRG